MDPVRRSSKPESRVANSMEGNISRSRERNYRGPQLQKLGRTELSLAKKTSAPGRYRSSHKNRVEEDRQLSD